MEVGDQPSELLDLAVTVVEVLCADLVNAEMIERARVQCSDGNLKTAP